MSLQCNRMRRIDRVKDVKDLTDLKDAIHETLLLLRNTYFLFWDLRNEFDGLCKSVVTCREQREYYYLVRLGYTEYTNMQVGSLSTIVRCYNWTESRLAQIIFLRQHSVTKLNEIAPAIN